MKQHSKSKKATISFKKWEYDCFLGFVPYLLKRKNFYNKKGAYFKKASHFPKETTHFISYLKANYFFDNHTNLISKYNFFSQELDRQSLNVFYNLISELKEKGVYQLNSDILFNHIDKATKRKNNLKELDTIIKPNEFFKIIT